MFANFVQVKLTIAFHGSVLPDGSNGGNPCGFLMTFADGGKIYDAADTALFGDMAMIGEEGLDLAILPIGDYYTMGPVNALRAVNLLHPHLFCPSITTPSRPSHRMPIVRRLVSRTRQRPSQLSCNQASGLIFQINEVDWRHGVVNNDVMRNGSVRQSPAAINVTVYRWTICGFISI